MIRQSEVLTRHDLEAKIEGASSRQTALPARPVNAAELSNTDLEKVAGGTELSVAVAIVAIVLGSAFTASAAGSLNAAQESSW
jgi:hypothetical protein